MLQPSLVPLTEEHGRYICSWRYPEPYNVYNWPSWDEMVHNQAEFADPFIRETQYMAYVDSNETLIGFIQLFPMQGVTRLGLGLRPDLCSKGSGVAFVQTIVQTAAKLNPEHQIDLEVLTWNHRAIKVYERAGFTISDTYKRSAGESTIEVHCMVIG